MKYIHNPFLLTGYVAPEYFCDRKEETRNLISALYNGRNITLMAPRRMGKTGLIHHCFHLLKEQHPDVACFYVDIFATKTLADFVSVFGRAVLGKLDSLPEKVLTVAGNIVKSARLVFSADNMGQPQASVEFQPHLAEATLSEIFTYLQQSGRECYIAIDEFQQVAAYPEDGVEALLRTYVQQCPNVRFIFSGSKQHMMDKIFNEASRPFYRSTEKMHLSAIAEPSYYEYAVRGLESIGVTIGDDVFSRLYQRFDGHTWYVQRILNRLFEVGEGALTDDDVEQSVQYVVATEVDDFQRHYARLTVNQGHLLKAIAKEHCVEAVNASAFMRKYNLKGTSSINKALAFLIDNEYAYRTSDGYIVYDRFMNLWLKTL